MKLPVPVLRFLFQGPRRILAYRWLAQALRRHATPVDALMLMWKHATDDGASPNRISAMVFSDWRSRLLAGESLGQALEPWVPPQHVCLLQSGESASANPDSLPNALEVCAWQEQVIAQLRKQLILSIVPPCGIFGMVIALYYYFSVSVIPEFEALVPSSEWQGVAGYLPTVMYFLLEGPLTYTFVTLVVLIAILVLFVLPNWTSPMRVRFEPLLPFKLYRIFAGTSFLLGLSGLLQAKLNLPSAFLLLQRGATPWFRSRLARILTRVRAGDDLGDAIWNADKYFPDIELNRQLRMVFSFPDFVSIIDELARDWVVTAEGGIAKLSAAIKGFVVISNGSLIGLLVLSLLQIVGQASN